MMPKVYFIKPVGFSGPIKIGTSNSPDRRMHSLREWSPFPLEIVAMIDGGVDVERRFHARFVNQHQSREWFAWSTDLQSVIDDIVRGTFDVASLPAPVRLAQAKRHGTRVWSEDARRSASITHRIRHIREKTGRMLPFGVETYGKDAGSPENVRRIEAFLADPYMNGQTLPEWTASYEASRPAPRPVPTTAQPGSPVRVLVPVDGGPCHHVALANPTLVEAPTELSAQEFGQ